LNPKRLLGPIVLVCFSDKKAIKGKIKGLFSFWAKGPEPLGMQSDQYNSSV
jgi:hypothetical protein